MLHDAAGEQVDLVGLAGGVQIEVGMRLVVALALIVHQGCEHQAGLHVVAVDDVVVRSEVGAALVIQEHGAILIGVAADVAVQVVLAHVAGITGLHGLHDGILQHGVGAVHIAHHVGILRLQSGEVNDDALGIGILLDLVLLIAVRGIAGGIVGIITAGIGAGEVVADVGLGVLRVLLVLYVGDDLYGREHQHAHQHHQNGVVEGLAALLALSVSAAAVMLFGRLILL